MGQGLPWKANTQLIKKFPACMEPESSLPCSQKPVVGARLNHLNRLQLHALFL